MRYSLLAVTLVLLITLSQSSVFAFGYANWEVTGFKVLESVNNKHCGDSVTLNSTSDMIEIEGSAIATSRWLVDNEKKSICTFAVDLEGTIEVDTPTKVRVGCYTVTKHVHLHGGRTRIRLYTTEGPFKVVCKEETYGGISERQDNDQDTICFAGDLKIKARILMSASLSQLKDELVTVSLHTGEYTPAGGNSFFKITFLPADCDDKELEGPE
ncbi:hypothetical protein UWK_01443 [Desulfocapsa sulfexigens DSM 10523]|uniref:Organic solvent tolerance-like N-terminal domain-containing protein n=1 Tax=Desulfocapsa sulfexigens (strain DSM 10523 / SB164P1) TaxID=1167006 RepID=M1P3H5_DESSD|nr:hypothetical protein [Desulfocapsa sulfexigens]AGF78003.1 hypothetical protein UWK_01443 [Desulfocapsa sulfexigens DSM 10523]